MRRSGLMFVAVIMIRTFLSMAAGQASPESGPPHLRPTLAPLLWTQGQPAETIRAVVREIAESGNTGFVWESRPHPDYLGPKWWADLKVAVDEARLRGLDVWIFDEWMYPSGLAGGKIIAENPELTHHVLRDRSLVADGPLPEKEWDIPGDLDQSEAVVSVTAFPADARKDFNRRHRDGLR